MDWAAASVKISIRPELDLKNGTTTHWPGSKRNTAGCVGCEHGEGEEEGCPPSCQTESITHRFQAKLCKDAWL